MKTINISFLQFGIQTVDVVKDIGRYTNFVRSPKFVSFPGENASEQQDCALSITILLHHIAPKIEPVLFTLRTTFFECALVVSSGHFPFLYIVLRRVTNSALYF